MRGGGPGRGRRHGRVGVRAAGLDRLLHLPVDGEDSVLGPLEEFRRLVPERAEAVQDEFDVGFRDPVEVEVRGVQLGSDLEAAVLVPDERRFLVAEVAGEGDHLVGGVGEFEDSVADPGVGGAVSQPGDRAGVGVGGQDRELFQVGVGEVGALRLLAGSKVQNECA